MRAFTHLLGGMLLCASTVWCQAAISSEVRRHNGLPALFIDGKLASSLTFYANAPEGVKPFLNSGITVGDFGVPFGWVGPEKYDFSRTDAAMDAYLKADPRLLALPRFSVTPGAWWCGEFPDEIARREDGTPAVFRAKCHPSFASARYRELARGALRAFLTHMEEKYGDRIVGYFPGNGVYGEWFSWNSYWEVPPGSPPPDSFGVEDYSAPAQAAFRLWLDKKYLGRVEDLRRAWGSREVTFRTAAVPSEKVRRSPTRGIFFDPAVSSQVPDYFEFFNGLISDVLIEQCRWTKQYTGRRKVVGAFYGYLLVNYPHLSMNHSGHLGLHKVLHSPDVDFIAGPYSYDNRQLGGANYAQTLPETIAMHGKLYFNEVDTETHLKQRQWRWGDSLRNPVSLEETRGLLLRDFAYAFTKGFGMWYMELHGGAFPDPGIERVMSEVRAVDQKYLGTDKRGQPEIAVIIDEASYRYFADGEVLFTALVGAQKQWELNFLGAPYDCYLMHDLADPSLPDYKLYVFLNTFRVSVPERQAIHRKLAHNGATALWVYAPGYITDRLSVESIRELTGIRVAESDSRGELRVEINGYGHPFTRRLPKGFAYGTDVNLEAIKPTFDHRLYLKDPSDPSLRKDLPGFRIAPRFYGDDPEAAVLGQLAGLDRPGLLVKAQKGWTSVYSSAPVVRAELLREIARAAGCHIYLDTPDVVYANRHFLGIYATTSGTKTVRLRQPARVVDLLSNRVVSSGKQEFTLPMDANRTVLLSLE